ncbi:hypothetical protein EI021_28845, partial [Escherichia coli]|nr:hypothetical protein [Escherichia coli]
MGLGFCATVLGVIIGLPLLVGSLCMLAEEVWQGECPHCHHQIITGVNGDHLERFIVVIELDEGGEFFKLYAPNLLPGIKTHPFRDAI